MDPKLEGMGTGNANNWLDQASDENGLNSMVQQTDSGMERVGSIPQELKKMNI